MLGPHVAHLCKMCGMLGVENVCFVFLTHFLLHRSPMFSMYTDMSSTCYDVKLLTHMFRTCGKCISGSCII